MAFKPTANVEDEGSFLWLGNNVGEIIELDVAKQVTATAKSSPHTRRDVVKIHRYKNQMWTIDDSGMLHVWGSLEVGGVPSLASSPKQSFRLSKGHTFSMIVGDELWQTFGKDIRVYRPTIDASVQFQVLTRPLTQANAGDITCGTTLSSQPNVVYFGHTDGKVSIYSRDYQFIGLVNISVYKVTSLVGVGGRLWASFSTGMIYVYDTTQKPWVVKKDWQAHQDPVVRLLADRSSFWTLDRSQIISLGQDNILKVWDGLLQEDWIGKLDELIDN
jgi:WD40 repeat protein